MFFFGGKGKDGQQQDDRRPADEQPNDSQLSHVIDPSTVDESYRGTGTPFEDRFMDAQSSVVSLINEALDAAGWSDSVEMIYLYAYLGDDKPSANAFCRVQSGLRTLPGLLGKDLFQQVFSLTRSEDLPHLQDVCRTYGQPVPVELFGRYDARTGSYTARYSYEPFDRGTGEDALIEHFSDWMDQVEADA